VQAQFLPIVPTANYYGYCSLQPPVGTGQHASASLLLMAVSVLTCETNKLRLQLNDLAVHRAANGIAQNQDVLALALTLPQNQGDKAVCRIIITGTLSVRRHRTTQRV
jgi:hypothetical protein